MQEFAIDDRLREKQMTKVLENTNFMYSAIKGIAGKAIPTIVLLELPGADEPLESNE